MPLIVVNTDDLLSIDEAIELLGIGAATFYRRLKAGKIAHIKVGRRTLIPKQEIERIQSERG